MALDKLLPSVALPSWPILLAGVIFGIQVWKWVFPAYVLPDLPILGFDKSEWFPWIRAWIRSLKDHRALHEEAYEKYLSKGKPCIIPEWTGDIVVLPNESTQWIVDQPDHILSAAAQQQDLLVADYTFPSAKMARFPYHAHTIKTDMTRKLAGLTTDLMDELAAAFDESWGRDTENWTQINVFQNMMKVVTRASNFIFVGRPLCRNDAWLHHCQAFAEAVPLSGMIIRPFPKFLHPILALVLTIPNKYHAGKIRTLLAPEFERRLAGNPYEKPDDEEAAAAKEPNDFLQWYIRYARKALEPEESTPRILAARIATINFAAIHTSTFSATNAIYDLLSLPDSKEILATLEEEIQTVLAAEGGKWTKNSLNKMTHLDSAVRESLRFSSFMSQGMNRRVVAKEGVVTPEGVHISQGNSVAVSAPRAHRDETVYANPNTFEPFRFVKKNASDASNLAEKNSHLIVDTNVSFLTFGHGKHGCPGRFFAANEIKLLIAYMILNYEIEPLKERPSPVAFGSTFLPNMKVDLRIRRRK